MSWCVNSAPLPTPRLTRSTRGTRYLSAGTKPPRCSSVKPPPPVRAARAAEGEPMNSNHDELNILAPREMKPKLDYLHREVQRAPAHRINRREALTLAGLA